MEILLLTFLTVVAAFIGTLSGFGISTILVPVMVFFLPLPETLLLVGIIHWFGDLWKVGLFHQGIKGKLIFTFGIPGIIMSVIGAQLVMAVPAPRLTQALGILLIIYSVSVWLKPTWKIPARTETATLGGLLSGFLAGLLGVGGAVRGAFLSAFNLPKATYIATAGIIGFMIDSGRLVSYVYDGVRLPSLLWWGLPFFIIASLAGALIAKQTADRIAEQQFRSVIAVFLVLMGVRLII